MAGYIPLSRKYFDHPFWKRKRKFSEAEAWLDIIQSARFESEPEKLFVGMKLIKINRGEFRASVRYLSQRWKWSKDKVARFLNLLEEDTMIRKEMRHGEPIIILLNYNKFNPITAEFCDSNKDTNEPATRTRTSQPQGQTKEREESKERKESLFRQRFFSVLEIFYFKNFKNPVAVTKAFFHHYEGIGWKNARGLDIENIESVAENWDNKTTQGVNCPPALLVKWKVMYGIIRNHSDQHHKFLLIRPAKLEQGELTIRGQQKDIAKIEENNDLIADWRNALFASFGEVKLKYEIDNQSIEA